MLIAYHVAVWPGGPVKSDRGTGGSGGLEWSRGTSYNTTLTPTVALNTEES